ncbi:MAG: oligosaccharide flippase family protein, partial [Candidatus Lutacidiplasmatales archaeon]
MATYSDDVVRDGLSSVTKGTLFLLVSTLLLVGLNFVSRVVVVRSISKAEWDAFSFGLTLSWVLSAVGALGWPSALARSLPYAATDEERRSIVRGVLWIGATTAFGSSALLYLFAQPIGQALGFPGIALGLEFFPIAVGTSIMATLIASIFQGYEDV